MLISLFSLRLNSGLLALSLLLGGCLGHSADGSHSGTPNPAPVSPAPVNPNNGTDQPGATGDGSGNPAQTPGSVGVAQGLQFPLRLPVSYPPMALEYLNATLRDPATAQHSDLSQAWAAVASLSNAAPLASTIGQQVRTVAAGPLPPLIAAWISANPDEASAWLIVQLNQGKYPYLQALADQPETGRIVLRKLKLDATSKQLDDGVMNLLSRWEPLRAEDAPLLQPLAASADPATKFRAIGYLISIGKASDGQLDELKQALASDKNSILAPAVEACRICHDERLGGALVTRTALIPLGPEDTSGGAQHDSTALYISYALSYTPGAQAKLLRQKLLGAVDSQVRWQVRLGELLHGDIQPWYDAVLKVPDTDRGLWITLQPEGVADPALLQTYKKAAASSTDDVRLRVALQLNRYGAYTSDKLVGEILGKLMQDKVMQIRAQAWNSAAMLHLDGFGAEAQRTLDDSGAAPAVRLAAALYELKLAEPVPAREPAAPDRTAGDGGKS